MLAGPKGWLGVITSFPDEHQQQCSPVSQANTKPRWATSPIESLPDGDHHILLQGIASHVVVVYNCPAKSRASLMQVWVSTGSMKGSLGGPADRSEKKETASRGAE